MAAASGVKRRPAKKVAQPSATSLKAQVAAQAQEIAKLRADMELLSYLHAELKAKMGGALAQLLLQNPAVQAQLQQELMRRMGV